MCRMLAVVGKPDVEIFRLFQRLAETGIVRVSMEKGHNDGFGICGFEEDNPKYFVRSTESAQESEDYDRVIRVISNTDTRILLAHLRKATGGSIEINNTHPFIQNGWMFCHNGTVFSADNLNSGYKTTGSTDSEKLFYFLLEKIQYLKSIDEIKSTLIKAIEYIRQNNNYTSLTFILANKNYLIAYRDFNEEYNEEPDLDEYYTLNVARDKNSIVVCSEKIGNLNYLPFNNRQMVIINNNNLEMFQTFLFNKSLRNR